MIKKRASQTSVQLLYDLELSNYSKNSSSSIVLKNLFNKLRDNLTTELVLRSGSHKNIVIPINHQYE